MWLVALVLLFSFEAAAIEHREPDPARFDSFLTIEGVKYLNYSEGEFGSSLSAGRFVARPRPGTGRAFVYRDFFEILASKVEIRLPASKAGESFSARILDHTRELVTEGALRSMTEASAHSKNARLSRALFSEVSILVEGGDRPDISIAANSAKLHPDGSLLHLAGNVVLRTSSGQEVRALEAVIASGIPGVYLPRGYTIDGKRFRNPIQWREAESGEVAFVEATADPAYEDPLEKYEGLVITHFMEAAPPALQPVLMMLFGHLRANSNPSR